MRFSNGSDWQTEANDGDTTAVGDEQLHADVIIRRGVVASFLRTHPLCDDGFAIFDVMHDASSISIVG